MIRIKFVELASRFLMAWTRESCFDPGQHLPDAANVVGIGFFGVAVVEGDVGLISNSHLNAPRNSLFK